MKVLPTIIWTAGQQTALVVQDGIDNKESIARDVLQLYPTVDQVGFVSVGASGQSKSFSQLTMMGGELSINGCIAAGYLLGRMSRQSTVEFRTSCLSETMIGNIGRQTASITLPPSIVRSIDENEVVLQGIRYRLIFGLPSTKVLTAKQQNILKKMLLSDPAAGLVFYEKNRIVPVVAVCGTKTVYWEQACGSGSLAYSLISGEQRIRQPSGEFLTLSVEGQTITITAATKEISI